MVRDAEDDFCPSDFCKNGGYCVPSGDGNKSCLCPPGKTGEDCSVAAASCADDNACAVDAQCVNKGEGFVCDPGSDPCSSSSLFDDDDVGCANGGECLPQGGGRRLCECRPGFGGERCETELTPEMTVSSYIHTVFDTIMFPNELGLKKRKEKVRYFTCCFCYYGRLS